MNFFIHHPIFAMSIALIMILAGAVAIIVLPVAQYPPLVPPAVQLSTQYIGANANVVANTVTTPLEEQINGAEGMIYMTSTSTNNGDACIIVTFEVGFDQDIAQMDVLTRSNQAVSELPPEVIQVGLTIEKHSTNMVLAVNLVSPNGTYDANFLQNYADIHITDSLARISGVASILNVLKKYAMRIWLDPAKLTNLGLTAMDVQNAIEEQNQQVAAGQIGQAPAPPGQAFQYQLSALGRLEQVSQFENIILRAKPDGSIVRIKDVARVGLGSEVYDWDTNLNGQPAASIIIYQLANANGLQIKESVVEEMDKLAEHFPSDMEWQVHYDTTDFIKTSMQDVVVTLIEAIILVIIVVFVFLQNFRATLIPIIAVPVSLIGTFMFMLLFGFSINTLSMLGMVLAVALVVDDAIVIVENVTRKLEEGGRDLKQVTSEALAEVRGPIVATTIVLMAVFVPVAFIPGMTGMLYNQFALTIAMSVFLSGINSLTLSPALCGILLRPPSGKEKNKFFRIFNNGFEKLSKGYADSVKILARRWYLVIMAFIVLCLVTVFLFSRLPTGFVPEEDQGYCLVIVELPEAATIDRTKNVLQQISEISLKVPGVADIITVSGYNVIKVFQQPYAGFAFVILNPWDERKKKETQLTAIMANLQKQFNEIPEANITVANAPAIPGLGTTGGFTFEIQDINDQGIDELAAVTSKFIKQARDRPELAGIYTTFSTDVPQRYIDVDRIKAKMHKVSITEIFKTLQINLGSVYVNEFNKFGKVYRVYIQAEADSRSDEVDIGRLKVRNEDGKMMDLSTFIDVKPIIGPYNISHYNEYKSVDIEGGNAPGYSSGQAIEAMDELAKEVLPEGYATEWTDITYQQLKAGNMAPIIFCLSLIFVFLVLSAQYESWTMPIMVLLGVPLGMLGAVGFLMLRKMNLDVYGQIGLVMLIGLTAKNGILIVQFAAEQRRNGASILDSAMTAARIRLRPILMTALAFVIGLIPLVISSGAGANARRSLGTTVVGGLAVATILIVFVPIFYFMIEKLRERKPKVKTVNKTFKKINGSDDINNK